MLCLSKNICDITGHPKTWLNIVKRYKFRRKPQKWRGPLNKDDKKMKTLQTWGQPKKCHYRGAKNEDEPKSEEDTRNEKVHPLWEVNSLINVFITPQNEDPFYRQHTLLHIPRCGIFISSKHEMQSVSMILTMHCKLLVWFLLTLIHRFLLNTNKQLNWAHI